MEKKAVKKPKTIDRYQIIEKLGQGAMAVVYKAYDPRIGRELAIKLLRKERVIDEEYLTRFQREAKAVGALSHPNIVTVFDVGEFDQRPYIVMELLEGTPLDELMNSSRKYTAREALPIAMQLAGALNYAHSRGIVHRDIKPSNIVFSPNNEIKITDFGIAHFDSGEATQQTRMGDVLGTPQYMSPEQVLGQKIDGRSDLFSVGVILYQLLTGQRPFTGDTVATLMYQIANTDPLPMEELGADIPASLRKITHKLLAKVPKNRFQSGNELAESLAHVLEDLEAKEQAKDTKRIIPLRVKWSLIMVSIVSVTMLASINVIYKKQYESMRQQVFDYGSSIVRFVASESAVDILSEDWVAIDLYVQGTSERKEFVYLTIIDHNGIVRGASDQSLVDKPYAETGERQRIAEVKEAEVFSAVSPQDNSKIFDFKSPILFRDKKIGTVHLGISQNSLDKVANLTLYLMTVLLVVTLGVVAVFSYILANYFSAPIKVVNRALTQLRNNRMDYRIDKTRNDEFGQLYSSFNSLADALQKRNEKSPD
ncbi:MAG: protein kinase [Gammaproteobacteria bacterium]|nr:protein kinase [Gammaproteobacteria bacterium]